MPATKITKFLGIAPKVAPELLPDGAAQVAANVKLYSGDLIPYRTPRQVDTTYRAGDIQTIYPMRDPVDDTLNYWLSWEADVDVATSTSLDDEEQRVYYTGDGAPKVTNYELAIAGGGPYPAAAYTLGLPLPTAIPTAVATSYSTKTISSYSRDSGNVATVNLSSAHGLKSGAVVTISGFNDTSPDTTPFNVTNTTITVVDSDTVSYYNVGNAVSNTSTDTDGRMTLAGGTILRSYVYTWMTPWGEESIPSDPSEPIFIKEGQVVTVSNLPNSAPAGDYNIRGIRLYRTVTSSSGTEYFRLRTLWFANTAVSASRTSNVVTMTFAHPHMLIEDDLFKVTGTAFGGSPDTSFNITGGVVASVVDDYTITYSKAGSDKATTVTTAGTIYTDSAEPDSGDNVYYEGTTFSDNYDVNGLLFPLISIEYDPPDEDMQGLISAHNNILVGFVGNELCFSEPGKPWAWPLRYRLVFETTIKAVASVSGYILVLTDKYPYIVEGASPELMQYSRIDAPYPCTSKRGVVNVGYGAVFPTHGGLAVFGVNGVELATKAVHDWDTWEETLDPTSIVAEFYAGKYFGSPDTRAFIFERDEETGGFLTTTPIKFTAAYYDAKYDKFFYVSDATGTIYQWDYPTNPLLSIEWKSKRIITQEYVNIGAARVVGTYAVGEDEASAIIDFNADVVAHNTAIWALMDQLGTINGPVDYVDPDTTAYMAVLGTFNSMMFNGDPVMEYTISGDAGSPVGFRLWADSELVADVSLANSDMFRLPSGYRSDTFEVAVSGSVRVKAIHLGETPHGLRTA